MKKILLMALAVLLLFSAMPVYAAEAVTPARQNANYMMSTAADGAPNWFNGTYYSSLYPDLQQAFGTNEAALYQHAMTHGFKEGRMVLPILDVAKYRAFYPDLDAAFGDSWGRYVRHYFEYGILEGRVNFTGFDPVAYLDMYPDLRAAFGSDLSLAARHYLEHGMTEGRAASRPVVVESKPSRPDATGRLHGTYDERDSSGSGWVSKYDNDVIVWQKYYEAGVLVACYTYDAEGNYKAMEGYEAGVLAYRLTYDAEGRIQEDVSYNPDGSVSWKFVHEYSSDGLRETRRRYQGDEYVGRDEYVYDEQGRTLSEHYYGFDSAGGTEELQNYNIYKYEHPAPHENQYSEIESYFGSGTLSMLAKYDTDGLVTADYQYDTNGALWNYRIYEYGFTGDACWYPSKQTNYRADDTVSEIYYYAESGNLTKIEYYRENGTLSDIDYYAEAGYVTQAEDYREDGTLQMISYYDENGDIPRYETYDEAGNLTGTFDGDGNPI